MPPTFALRPRGRKEQRERREQCLTHRVPQFEPVRLVIVSRGQVSIDGAVCIKRAILHVPAKNQKVVERNADREDEKHGDCQTEPCDVLWAAAGDVHVGKEKWLLDDAAACNERDRRLCQRRMCQEERDHDGNVGSMVRILYATSKRRVAPQ